MSLLVVVLLGGLWASILLPGAVRAHREASPATSVDDFTRSLRLLAPGSPPTRAAALRPPSPTTLARRRAVLASLMAAVPVTGLLATLTGGAVWLLFALAVAALAAYVGLLVHLRTRAEQTRRTVRVLAQAPVRAVAQDRGVLPPAVGESTVRVRQWGR